MKTRDKILAAALDLFNAEGVGGQSALDIATSMGISAGHLYYHFKGKPEILVGLMTRHGEEIDLIATALRDAAHSVDLDLQTLWTHVHILVEEVWDARFFWRETPWPGRFQTWQIKQGTSSRPFGLRSEKPWGRSPTKVPSLPRLKSSMGLQIRSRPGSPFRPAYSPWSLRQDRPADA